MLAVGYLGGQKDEGMGITSESKEKPVALATMDGLRWRLLWAAYKYWPVVAQHRPAPQYGPGPERGRGKQTKTNESM